MVRDSETKRKAAFVSGREAERKIPGRCSNTVIFGSRDHFPAVGTTAHEEHIRHDKSRWHHIFVGPLSFS